MLPLNSAVVPEREWDFQAIYKCFSVSKLQRPDVEKGAKIILPRSAFRNLATQNVNSPMLFKLKNQIKEHTSHAGVLEFIARKDKCYLPQWMMNNLQLNEGDNISIESVSLPVATFLKFQPLTSDFLDITNPKAVLENAFRNFACLTAGDVIAIHYNEKIYELCVLQTRPGNAVTIIEECDMNVEFEAPADYVSPSTMNLQDGPMDVDDVGVRLDGNQLKPDQMAAPIKTCSARGIPDYEYTFGILKFDRTVQPISDRIKTTENGEDNVSGFYGRGLSMK